MSGALGLVADADRLRVVAALLLGAATREEVAQRTGLDARAVSKALARLEAGGAVVEDGAALRLDEEGLVDGLREAAAAARPPREEVDSGVPARAAAVLRAFLRDGRLVSIPAMRSKRLVVLDHVARVFEPGERYAEREVDALLRAFHDDHAALRRHLVDEGFLSREAGCYWRSGGTVVL